MTRLQNACLIQILQLPGVQELQEVFRVSPLESKLLQAWAQAKVRVGDPVLPAECGSSKGPRACCFSSPPSPAGMQVYE